MVLSIAILISGSSFVFSQKSKSLEGVWKLVYWKSEFPDTVFEMNQFENPQYKIYTKKHFSCSFLNDADNFSGHYGTYTIDGGKLVEHYIFTSIEILKNKDWEYNSKMDGDKWHISWDARGAHISQTWQRVE